MFRNDFLKRISIASSEFVPSAEAMSMISKWAAEEFRRDKQVQSAGVRRNEGTRMSFQRDLFKPRSGLSVELGLSLQLLDFVCGDSPFRHCPGDLCSFFRQISVVLDFLRISLSLPRALRLFQR